MQFGQVRLAFFLALFKYFLGKDGSVPLLEKNIGPQAYVSPAFQRQLHKK